MLPYFINCTWSACVTSSFSSRACTFMQIRHYHLFLLLLYKVHESALNMVIHMLHYFINCTCYFVYKYVSYVRLDIIDSYSYLYIQYIPYLHIHRYFWVFLLLCNVQHLYYWTAFMCFLHFLVVHVFIYILH